jgi:serine/threonine-protein kinase RsbW
MSSDSNSVEVTLETLLESVDLAERIVMRVAEKIGFSEEDCHKIGMSVREAVINAYQYGNSQDRSRKMFLRVEIEGEKKLVVHIIDQGAGFELESVPNPLAEENLLRTSGRGLFLMKAFMDEFAVKTGPTGGAELVMAKYLPTQDACTPATRADQGSQVNQQGKKLI